jgi:hypothetical protein
MKDPLPDALPFGYRPNRRILLFHESRGLQTFTFRFALLLYPDVAVRVLLTLSLAISPRFLPRSFERRSEGKGRDDRWSRWELNPHCLTTCQSALHSLVVRRRGRPLSRPVGRTRIGTTSRTRRLKRSRRHAFRRETVRGRGRCERTRRLRGGGLDGPALLPIKVAQREARRQILGCRRGRAAAAIFCPLPILRSGPTLRSVERVFEKWAEWLSQ